MKLALHPESAIDRASRAFIAERGLLAGMRRGAEIDALPVVVWKGRALHTYRCVGGHDINAGDELGWSLISLTRFACPFHANHLRED